METICPFCHQKYALSEANARKPMRCPNCQRTFIANPLTRVGNRAGGSAGTVTPPGSVLPSVRPVAPTVPPTPVRDVPVQPDPRIPGTPAGTEIAPKVFVETRTASNRSDRRRKSGFTSLVEEVKRTWERLRLRWDASRTKALVLKKPLPFVVGVSVALGLLLVLGMLLLGTMSAKGVPSWARSYAPRDAESFIYVNFDEYRNSQLAGELDSLLPSRRSGLPVRLDEVRDVFVVVCRRSEEVFLLRTYADLPVSDLLSSSVRRNSESESYKGFEYARVPSTDDCLAKTGDRMYCGTDSEDDMERTLKRLSLGESEPLDKGLERAVASVCSADFYAAGRVAELRDGIQTVVDALTRSNQRGSTGSSNELIVEELNVELEQPKVGPLNDGGREKSTRSNERSAKSRDRVTQSATRVLKTFGRAECFAASLSLDEYVTVCGRVMFSDQSDAQNFAASAEDYVKTLAEEGLDYGAVSEEAGAAFLREAKKHLREVLDVTQIRRRGSEVRIDTRVESAAVVDMVKRAKGEDRR